MALMASRVPKVLARAVGPSGPASHRYRRWASAPPSAGGSTTAAWFEHVGERFGGQADRLGPRRQPGTRPSASTVASLAVRVA